MLQECEIIFEDNSEKKDGMGRGKNLVDNLDFGVEVDEEKLVSGVLSENRNFLTVMLAGEKYRALLDPGAMISLVGPKISERFRSRLQPSSTMIRAVTGAISKVLGALEVHIEIDSRIKRVNFRATADLDQEMILGMDFCKDFGFELKLGEGQWRIEGGDWHAFSGKGSGDSIVLYGECAGICELGESEKDRMDRLIDEILARQTGELGLTDLIEHRIELTDTMPIRHKFRRMSPRMIEIATEEVNKLAAQGVIERSASDYNSAPVLVRKSDGSCRMCIDYRDLNKKTKRDAYPVPNMDTILDKLRKAKYLSKIDLKSAYHQIPMESSSKRYTAFALPGSGLWQYRRLPFGLSNAPMTFMRLIDALFGPEVEPHIFGYLDDIIVVTENFEDHLHWVKVVLERLIGAGLSVNRDKCEFGCSRVVYLGFLLDNEGLRPDPSKIAPVLEYPAPKSVKQLRRFLGMVGWYARFIERDSEHKIPLVKLLRKTQTWEWGEEQQTAFDALKRALTTAPVLARPDFSKPFTIQCDASGVALGVVLTQEGEGGEHPIVYASRVLTAAERNYSTSEKECLAVLWAIKKLRPYIEGYRFRVITDHSALKWLRNLKDPTGRLARWALEMQQWDFEIIHRKGALNHLPDALSRMYEEGADAAIVESFEEVSDPWYLRMINDVQNFPHKFRNWKVEEGRLYNFRTDELLDPILNREECWRLVVPLEYRERILRDAHCLPSSGHLGVEKTYDRIAREYYWKGVYYDVINFIKGCQECQRFKISQTGKQGLMGSRIVERPWAVVAADLMEFPPSKAQNKYLIVFQDVFTRWIEVKPVRKADGKTVAKALEELILFRWEAPEYFLTDNGKEFINKHLEGVLKEYGIKHVTSPPYHAQSNPVERSNRTLKTMISAFIKSDQRDWDLHIHEFRHAINTAVQSSTKVSPAFLNYGRHPRPVKSLRREVEGTRLLEKVGPEVWLDRVKRLDALRDLVARHIDDARARQEKYYNRGKRDVRYFVGDLVMRKVHVLSDASKRFNAKLAAKFEGPYKIVEVLSPSVYVVEKVEGTSRRIAKIHVSELKRYVPPRQLTSTGKS